MGVPFLSRTFDKKKFFTVTNIYKVTLELCIEAGISLHVKFPLSFLDLNQNQNLQGIFS